MSSTNQLRTSFGRLQGRVAIVTGASSGIGRAIAIAYAREGAKVVCASRKELSEGIDTSTAHVIAGEGGDATFHCTDISSTISIDGLIEEAVNKYGRLDMYFGLLSAVIDRLS